MKIGLKLYSTNTELIPEALSLKNEYFNFVELYVIPGSYDKTISAWKEFNVPYVIHAPHSFHGMNLARPEYRETNMCHVREAQCFSEELCADSIIVHGGNNGNIDETIRQLRYINDCRIIIENKPKQGVLDEECIGWSPSEFEKLVKAEILNGMALDFTHAVCAARTIEKNEYEFIRSFLKFEPKIFHLSDIDSSSHKDMHLNLGKGSMKLDELLSFIPKDGLVTVETPRSIAGSLSEFVKDIIHLRKLSA